MNAPTLLASASVPRLSRATGIPAAIDVDVLVVAVAVGQSGPEPTESGDWVDAALGRNLGDVLDAMGATGEVESVTRVPCAGPTSKARTLLAVGLGPSNRVEAASWRRAMGAALRTLRGTARVGVVIPGGLSDQDEGAAIEGALLGAYSFEGYRTVDPASAPVEEIVIINGRLDDGDYEAITAIVNPVALVRDLVNTPAADLGPADLAAIAQREAGALGVDVEILEEGALLAQGYGGIVGVGRGSARGPRLVRLTWQPPRAQTRVALVGKGITFDSGGLSLKPTVGMQNMKCDMAGAGAVLGAVLAAAALKLPVAVTGWLCLAENMPSGTATRMGDVLTMYGGKRVEVMNTDAEGRLVLADGLARAAEDHPDMLIDVATLTGAQMQALGNRTAGIMGSHDKLVTEIAAAAQRAGEPMWAMPMPEELKANLKSEIADLANLAPGESRPGGMLFAAHFLAEFVPSDLPWAHIDLAGPSWNRDGDHGYTPRGGTGFGVRTFVELLIGIAHGSQPATRNES